MNYLNLKKLSFEGPEKEPASVELRPGLNVICGASETGKSFFVDAIDFMLGGTKPLEDIPQRVGYDRIVMSIEHASNELVLERSTEGGDFKIFQDLGMQNREEAEHNILREANSASRTDTFSYALLNLIGLTDKYLRKNARGNKRILSIRDLARLCVVTETEIQQKHSPILTEQWVQHTSEFAAFKLLLTGLDDSSLVTSTRSESQINSDGKIEILNELIEKIDQELQDVQTNETQLQAQLVKINDTLKNQRESLTSSEERLDKLMVTRSKVHKSIQENKGRLTEVKELKDRFKLLNDNYISDLRRLESIAETGSILVHYESDFCPLCGAKHEHQRATDNCEGNFENIVESATAETQKIKHLQSELKQTVEELNSEETEIGATLEKLESLLKKTNEDYHSIILPNLTEEKTKFDQLVTHRANITLLLDKFSRKTHFEEQKRIIESANQSTAANSSSNTVLSDSVLNEFSEIVERILIEWNYPYGTRVSFDSAEKDIQISGKKRRSNGKGIRAITHAAVNLALLEYCVEKGLPHLGILVLDSPLLAYWEPENENDDLSGSDLKERFYNYLLGLNNNYQVIVIENEHPPTNVTQQANTIVFTGSDTNGRYGFFPN